MKKLILLTLFLMCLFVSGCFQHRRNGNERELLCYTVSTNKDGVVNWIDKNCCDKNCKSTGKCSNCTCFRNEFNECSMVCII
ncbi:MAG: hypothetical protein LBJ68_00030 [Endomicrobium sp.]|jgi:hypothetical protein|nr:hypothetical protein [Endomicrobium sp.]